MQKVKRRRPFRDGMVMYGFGSVVFVYGPAFRA